MPENIETDTAIKVFDSAVEDLVLDEHVAQIRKLGKRIVEDVVEIGRRLTECKKILRQILGHGNWLPWLDQEFGWSEATARNFMRVYQLTQSKFANFADLNLPVSALYLLAAPNTPEQARQEIVERAEAGEKLTLAEVTNAVQRAKQAPNGTAEPTAAISDNTTNATAEDDSAEKRKAFNARLFSETAEPATPELVNEVDSSAVPTEFFEWASGSDIYDFIPAHRRAEVCAAFLDSLTTKGMLAVMSAAFGQALRDAQLTNPIAKLVEGDPATIACAIYEPVRATKADTIGKNLQALTAPKSKPANTSKIATLTMETTVDAAITKMSPTPHAADDLTIPVFLRRTVLTE
jgi:hypothetical protein